MPALSQRLLVVLAAAAAALVDVSPAGESRVRVNNAAWIGVSPPLALSGRRFEPMKDRAEQARVGAPALSPRNPAVGDWLGAV